MSKTLYFYTSCSVLVSLPDHRRTSDREVTCQRVGRVNWESRDALWERGRVEAISMQEAV